MPFRPLLKDRLAIAYVVAARTASNNHDSKQVLKTVSVARKRNYMLVGLAAAADLAKSQIASPDGDFVGDSQIHNLVIDESKTHDLLMFRLKEKFSTLLVHRKVREAIESRGIDGVEFIAPEDYMAI